MENSMEAGQLIADRNIEVSAEAFQLQARRAPSTVVLVPVDRERSHSLTPKLQTPQVEAPAMLVHHCQTKTA